MAKNQNKDNWAQIGFDDHPKLGIFKGLSGPNKGTIAIRYKESLYPYCIAQSPTEDTRFQIATDILTALHIANTLTI